MRGLLDLNVRCFATVAALLIAVQAVLAQDQPVEKVPVPTVIALDIRAALSQGNAPGLKALLDEHRTSSTEPRLRNAGPTTIFERALSLGLAEQVKSSIPMSLKFSQSGNDMNTFVQSLSRDQVENAVKLGLIQLTGLNPPKEGLKANAIKSGASRLAKSEPLAKRYDGDPDPAQPSGDWRIPRIMMRVKDSDRPDQDQRNQGRGFDGTKYRTETDCGSCWAFATAAAFEHAYAVQFNKYINISEQEILNNADPNFSCNGGWWAFDYLMSHPVSSEINGRYLGSKRGSPSPPANPRFKVKQWGYVNTATDIPDVLLIKNALCRYGPLAAGIRATPAFANYPGGVFTENDPGPVNHAVLIVGWNDQLGGGCWVIRNSWGGDWGENGFMNIAYGSNKVGYGAAWVVPEEAPAP